MRKNKLYYSILAAALISGNAYAELAQFGAKVPATGYPEWYQDKSGTAFDLCVAKTQEELDLGLCLILPADVPSGLAPESLPNNFATEHFYWTASATTPVNGSTASLILALEASFAPGTVVPGQQITFGRIRISVRNVPSAGTYIVDHPYGREEFPNLAAGDRIFLTQDVGILCPLGDFSCALNTNIGPFLLPASTPGGVVKAPLQLASGSYISDGATPEFVTGSPFNQNFFRITGPDIGGPGVNVVEVDTFTMTGKIHEGAISSPTIPKRASYKRSSLGIQIDKFVSSLPSVTGVIPQIVSTFSIPDLLGNFISAVKSLLETDNRGNYWGQDQIAGTQSLPSEVTFFNNGDSPPSAHSIGVHDEVKITSAIYSPATKQLTVNFSSTDLANPIPRAFNFSASGVALSLIDPLTGLVQQGNSTLTIPVAQQAIGSFSVVLQSTGVMHDLLVSSEKGGVDSAEVEIQPLSALAAVAADDVATTVEDTAVTLNLIANDQFFAAGSLAIVGNPINGTLVVNAAAGSVRYTPRLNFFGTDGFTYTVSAADGTKSNLGTVRVTVTPVNDAPVAVNDTAVSVVGNPSVAVNVLANDRDPDGDPLSIVSITPPTVGVASIGTNGTIIYTPPATIAANTVVNIAYTTSDTAGVRASATLAMTVNRPDTLTATATYTTRTLNWSVSGTSNLALGQTITVVNGATYSATAPVIGTAVVGANGRWSLSVTSNIRPTTPARISLRSSFGGLIQNVTVSVK